MKHKQVPITIVLLAALLISAAFTKAGDSDPLGTISIAVKAREFDRALEAAKVIGKKDPLPKELANVLIRAGAASVNEMKLEAAAGFYRLLLDKFPESEHASTARSELLGCCYHLRQLEACIAQAKVNLKLDPESRWVEYWTFVIAQSDFRLWRFTEAKTKLEAFLVKYPNGDYAKHARSCLNKIDPPWDIDRNGLVSYSGKYDGDIRLEAAVTSLPADMEAGFRMLDERLGLDLRPHTHVIYLFKDAGNKTKSGLKASTFVVGRDNKPAVVMRFYSEYVVARPDSYRQTITHEMKHAGFKGIMGQAYTDFLPLRKAHEKSLNAGKDATRKWLKEGGESAFETWLAKHPGHPAEPFVRFCLARSLARAGRGSESRKLLQHILVKDGLRCTLLDDAQFWIGVSYNWEKDFDNAGVAFGVLLRDFPFSHSAKQVFGKFAAAGPVTE